MQKKRGQFSLEIIHCDGFVELPATAQALYFQILSSCDDEGFTSQLGMCKFMAHANNKDIDELVKKEFILQVGERKVTVIKHWRMNVWLRNPDKSSFPERALVYVNKNGNYTLDPNKGTPLEQRDDSTTAVNEQQSDSDKTGREQRDDSTTAESSLLTQTPERDFGAQTPERDSHSNPITITNHTNNNNNTTQKIKPNRTQYKQTSLLQILLDSGYLNEDEIEDGWDDLLNSYVEDHGYKDTKIKVKYFIERTCRVERTENDNGSFAFKKKWHPTPGVVNRYSYFKSSMDKAFSRNDINPDQGDDDPF